MSICLFCVCVSAVAVSSLTPVLTSMKCTESEEEEPTKGKESQLQLSCFINQEVKYLNTGLRLVSPTRTHTGARARLNRVTGMVVAVATAI